MVEMIPDPAILRTFREREWDTWEALGEHVANAWGSDRGNANRVDLYWNPRTRWLDVLDEGRGPIGVSYLFRLGKSAPRSGHGQDIGKYGQGGSTALLSLADVVEVWGMRDGKVSVTKQNIARALDGPVATWLDVDDVWETATISNTDGRLFAAGHGTLIRHKMRAAKHVTASVIQRQLSRKFAPGLRAGRQIFWHEGGVVTELAAWDPGETGTEISGAFDVITNDENGTVLTGSYKMAYSPNVTIRDSRIDVGFEYVNITQTKEPFGGYNDGKLYGWVDLGPEWFDYLSPNKSKITNDEIWDSLMGLLGEEIKPLLDLMEEQAIEQFSAKLEMEANIHWGGVAKKVRKRTKQEPSDDPKPFPAEEIDWKEKGEVDEPGAEGKGDDGKGLPIKVTRSDSLDQVWMTCDIIPGKNFHIKWNSEVEALQEARRKKPHNEVFWRFMISDVISGALIRDSLVTEAGLMDAEEWEQLNATVEHSELELSAVVKAILFDRIQPVPKKGAAA